ncbi:hypothetical protein [Pseudonocardia sp.]|uniref:hypothetical protein n=1 Tax=Pseudonocardia sp. TaxID=60912 RepID=UPI00263A21AE|nr:hypothetical protein [Pseudonocardia sp.]
MKNGDRTNAAPASERWGALVVVGAIGLLAVVAVIGLVMWNDLGGADVADTAAATGLARGAVVAALACAVVALPFALRPGMLPWVLPAVLSVAGVALVVGWRASGPVWGSVQIAMAVVCGLAAVVAVLAAPAVGRTRGRT